MVGRWIVVDQAGSAELVENRLVARAELVLEARDDLDVVGQGSSSLSVGVDGVALRESAAAYSFGIFMTASFTFATSGPAPTPS
jgi:hypothetical protein